MYIFLSVLQVLGPILVAVVIFIESVEGHVIVFESCHTSHAESGRQEAGIGASHYGGSWRREGGDERRTRQKARAHTGKCCRQNRTCHTCYDTASAVADLELPGLALSDAVKNALAQVVSGSGLALKLSLPLPAHGFD